MAGNKLNTLLSLYKMEQELYFTNNDDQKCNVSSIGMLYCIAFYFIVFFFIHFNLFEKMIQRVLMLFQKIKKMQ